MPETLTAIIADDELLARRKLRQFASEVGWIVLAGEAADGPETVQLANAIRPDILFLDIQMPGFTGLEVLDRLEHRPRVVFTTAHDQYAVAAFELQAVDYLLKPFGRKRFLDTLARVRAYPTPTGDESSARRARLALGSDQPLQRVFVRRGSRIVRVATADMIRFEGADDYTKLHAVGGESYLLSVRMKQLEARLDKERFMKVHRSHVVNLDHVVSFDAHVSGRLEVFLSDGSSLFASRTRSRALRKLTL
jgi:two-component system LytT family response regulator